MRIAFFLFMLVVLAGPTSQAQARWKAEYASHTRQQRDWYESQTTTAATRERIKASWYVSCCLHADTVKAHFTVSKVDGADRWLYQIDGTTEWHVVPSDTVQTDIQTPDDKPVLFVDATGRDFGPVCFFPGVGRY
jgi:hypothetical protein